MFKYSYDTKGLLSEETLPFENNYTQSKKYTYDKNGNMLTFTTSTNKPEETVTTYTYDSRNRLTSVSAGGIMTTQYVYDAAVYSGQSYYGGVPNQSLYYKAIRTVWSSWTGIYPFSITGASLPVAGDKASELMFYAK